MDESMRYLSMFIVFMVFPIFMGVVIYVTRKRANESMKKPSVVHYKSEEPRIKEELFIAKLPENEETPEERREKRRLEFLSNPENNICEIEMTDTIRWFCACNAVLTEANEDNYKIYGQLPVNEKNREIARDILSRWWDIHNRADAERGFRYTFSVGHGIEFKEINTMLKNLGIDKVPRSERAAFIEEHTQYSKESAVYVAKDYDLFERFGPNSVLGWDYSRCMMLLSFFYLAGFYSLEEALDNSLEVAKAIQSNFSSWEELVTGYMVGYDYWSNKKPVDRMEAYEALKKREDNPYKIPFDLKFEKTW